MTEVGLGLGVQGGNYGTNYNCTYNHIWVFKGLINGL